MDAETINDREYQPALMEALGRNIAAMFLGMVDAGMWRDEALEVVTAYVIELARPKAQQ